MIFGQNLKEIRDYAVQTLKGDSIPGKGNTWCRVLQTGFYLECLKARKSVWPWFRKKTIS